MTGNISDGFGEQLSAEEVLHLYEQRARVIAWEWQTPAAPKEDLAQEARIALWQEAVKRPGDRMQGLASVVIRRAVSNAAVDQRWTGTDYTRGKHKDPIRRDPRDLDAEMDNGLMLIAQDLLAEVEYAYHEGEIMAVLNALSEDHREYVYLKFWMGMSESEIAAHVGRTKSNVNRTWHEVIRPRLKAQLAHLAGAW